MGRTLLPRDQSLQECISELTASNRPWTPPIDSYKCVLGSGTENSTKGSKDRQPGGQVSHRTSCTLPGALFPVLFSLLTWILTMLPTTTTLFPNSIYAMTLVFGSSLSPHSGFRRCGLSTDRDARGTIGVRQEGGHRI